MRFLLVALGLLLVMLAPGAALAQEQDRSFPQTGYTIADDAIWAFWNEHGGLDTFGAPISRETTLLGSQVQVFENAALVVHADGSVVPLSLGSTLPYQHFDGLTVPAADAAMAFVAPSPDQPNYAARLNAYLGATIAPQFAAAYDQSVWGLPTSSAQPDPNNPNFDYQRFQNGVLMADLGTGTVGPLPLGTYLKAVLTGQNLPSDLATEVASSPLFHQFVANEAFTPDA
jgi:hypothetical protein